MKAALGALVVAAHAAGFAALIARCHRAELAVELHAPPAADHLTLDAKLPDLAIAIADEGVGLVRRSWTVRYRGGVERSVGAAQLVGPFQDGRACVGRVVVGQALLDDGGPGTVAAAMRHELEAELRGLRVIGAGDFVRLDRLALRWARLEAHPEDAALVGAAPHGYVRASAVIELERVTVPIAVALVPVVTATELRFRATITAQLAFGNRVAQWLSDRLGGDRLATRLARRQLDDALIAVLAPPPPLALPDGTALRLTYCAEPPEIVDGVAGALPFAVVLGAAADPRIRPPRFGHGPRALTRDKLALDLDLDALNALLYELWRGGTLDRSLAAAGLDRQFNAEPTVATFLSLRVEPPRLTLPPVVTATPDGLRLSAEARLAIHDGATRTTGRVWGGLDFRFAPRAVEPVAVDLDALALSCEAGALLKPCYGDLVAAVRGRTGELHGALTRTFARLLSELFVGRLGAAGVPAALVIRGVTPSVAPAGHNATVHLALDAAVER
jgi:hypothetical protein